MDTARYNVRRGMREAVFMFVFFLAVGWIFPVLRGTVSWVIYILAVAFWSVWFAIMFEAFMTHLFPKVIRRFGTRKEQPHS